MSWRDRAHDAQYIIANKRWKLRYRTMKDHDGLTSYVYQTITIDPDQTKSAVVESLVHEILHAAIPVLREDTVFATAREITHILRKQGFINEHIGNNTSERNRVSKKH